jgi:hypothetical protein
VVKLYPKALLAEIVVDTRPVLLSARFCLNADAEFDVAVS